MKKWLKIIAWSLLCVGVLFLLSLAQHAQKETIVSKPEIVIHVTGESAFLTKDELYTRLKRKKFIYEGQLWEKLNVSAIENYIRSMSEVKTVKVFSSIGKGWEIEVLVRKPIARIYNTFGETYYLDEDGIIMKSSNLHTARVVVITGNIKDRINSKSVKEIINNPTLKSIQKLDQLYRISIYVCKDPLMQSLISQIHLKSNGDFVLIPLVGGQKIIFGSADSDEDVRDKFEKLKLFYKEAIPFEGWNKYKEISLKYKKQIVCKTVNGYTNEKEDKHE
jgi:cell division protein FtsQ